jgi:iron(III) transport system ATP-binding protein
MPEITVQGLTKAFGAERALHDVSFDVRDREFLTLLGPSGCGKTTTLMSIAGLQRPDAGRIACGQRIFFDHRSGVHLAAEERNLGIVFQSYAIWPHMTVAQNVAFPLKVRKLARKPIEAQVKDTLELVEMSAYSARYPHELSGGQQQRVALARALVYRPSVLLLDEPFSNLDAKLRERARTWLKHLQHTLGLTTLFVTHDQDEALSMSDRVLVMDHGEILQAGTPEDVYRQPTTRFVAEFLGHCNILTGRVIAHTERGEVRIAIGTGAGELTLPECGWRIGDTVELALRPEAIRLSENGTGAAENTFTAEVRSTSFLGDHYVYELEAGGLALSAKHTHAFHNPRLTVQIPPDACRVLRR